MEINKNLYDYIYREIQKEIFPDASEMTSFLKKKYSQNLMGILFYGSALRSNNDKNLILDFYVILEKLYPTIKSPIFRFFTYLLPPNVYFYEINFKGKKIRAKVAILTMSDFIQGTSINCFSPSIWARFSQQTRLTFYNCEKTKILITNALSEAVKTFLTNTIKTIHYKPNIDELWLKGLHLTYGSELRPENNLKIKEIIENDKERYIHIGNLALNELGHIKINHLINKKENFKWLLRKYWTRLLNVLRLIKASFTFEGGIEYLTWKLKRHKGISIELSEKQKKYPIITVISLAIKLKIWDRSN